MNDEKLTMRINNLLQEKQKTIKSLRQSLQYVQSVKSSILSGLRNTKEFDTQKDRDRHLTKLSNLLKNIERVEFKLKEVLDEENM